MQEKSSYRVNLPSETPIYRYKWVLGGLSIECLEFVLYGLFPVFWLSGYVCCRVDIASHISGTKHFFI